ncbi:MAG: putative LPS assembly protein LptD [Desulfomonilia bacterium]|nr:putative LPS assembly protein LptD [Desulfomonilia bacterium]
MSRLYILILSVVFPVHALAAILTVEADTIQKIGARIEASGNVIISGENITLKAGTVIYDTHSEDIWAVGDCLLYEETGEVRASMIYYNVRSKDFSLENGEVFIYDEPVKIIGEIITRYGEDFYTGKKITYTPCIDSPPAWSFSARDLEVPLEGYGTGRGVSFHVRTIPIMYVPYILFPAKLKRQSGLLFPEMSHSTDYGYRFGVPAYLVLGRSADLTLTPTYLSERGLLTSAEFRYRMDYEREGEFYVEHLRDKKGGEESPYGIIDEIPKQRWFAKAVHTGGSLTWDVNLVSNEDYLRDIGPFYGKSSDWRSVTLDGDEDLGALISRMQWTETARGISLGISARWTQDLTVEGDDRTLQELPKIRVRMNQRPVLSTPFAVAGEVSSTRVYSLDWIEAIKDDGRIEVSLPVAIHPYFTLRPYVSERYRDTLFTKKDGEYDKNTYAETWQIRGASLNTTLYSARFGNMWYHQIIPESKWIYRSRHGGNYHPARTDDLFPVLFAADEWEKQYDMNLSLANYIRDRSGKSLMDLSIDRTYSHLTREWDLFSARARFAPVDWLSVSHTNRFGRASLRPYATHEHATKLTLMDERGDELFFSEEYNREDVKTATGGFRVSLLGGFSARFVAKYDYRIRRFDYSRQGVTYDSQCWSIDFSREVTVSKDDKPRETKVGITVSLLGFGDVIQTSQSFEKERNGASNPITGP